MPTTLHLGIKAVIIQNDKLFLVKKAKSSDGIFWEVPGGRMEFGEDFHTTLVRELNEELLGITNIHIGRLLNAYKKPQPLSDGVELTLLYFLVDANVTSITLSSEHTDSIWVSKEEFAKLDAPANPLYVSFFP